MLCVIIILIYFHFITTVKLFMNDHGGTGRSWRASELRLKSFQDLHKLWFVLLKEKNMLLGQRLEAQVTKERDAFPHPHRLVKVKKSMARIKRVLSEREQIVEQARQYVRDPYALFIYTHTRSLSSSSLLTDALCR